MSVERLSAFQKAPEDASYKCGQCGNVLCLKKGQLLPPCPKCGHREDIFAHGGAQRTAKELDAEFLGEIPLDLKIRETSDSGDPIVHAQPDSQYAQSYMKIAARLWDKLNGVQKH